MSSFVAVAAALKHLRGCFVSITDCSFLFVSGNKSFWLRKDFPWRKIFDRGKKKRKEELSGKQQKRVFICARAAHVTDNFENLANTRLVDNRYAEASWAALVKERNSGHVEVVLSPETIIKSFIVFVAGAAVASCSTVVLSCQTFISWSVRSWTSGQRTRPTWTSATAWARSFRRNSAPSSKSATIWFRSVRRRRELPAEKPSFFFR